MDRRLKRVFVIVLDSMGMGAMAYSKPGIFRAGKPEILKTGTAAGTSTWILCGTE